MTEEKDLFGEEIRKASQNNSRKDLKASLKKHDNKTIDQRASRLELIRDLKDNHKFIFTSDFEGIYLFKECEKCFVNGLHASTIILAHGIIDRLLGGMLANQGFPKESKKGSKNKLDFIEQESLMHSFLIKEIDKLRRKRNRFVHLVEYDDGMQLEDRMASTRLNNPEHLVQKDAEFAIRLLYEFYSTDI